jgi:hypothetical protein
LVGIGQAESIGWVGGMSTIALYDTTTGLSNEQPFIDLLEAAGYEVTGLWDTVNTGALTTEQLDLLESFDLIIVGRSTNSGQYNDAMSWNSITKPLILTTAYLSRNNRWFWFNSSALIGVSGGRSGAPGFQPEVADHPIFAGITPDADGLVYPLDPTVGCGNTSLPNWDSVGDDGMLIATTVNADSMGAVPGAVGIAYWPADAGFYPETDQFAGAARLFFPCGTQEDAGICPKQGEYNLTADGVTMFLNAVAFMLGKEVGVAQNPATVPVNFSLDQNYPNPFNPTTTLGFSLSGTSNVKLSVYNMLGQKVVTLADQVYQAGTFSVTWDGRDSDGQTVESGVYLYKLETENQSLAKKMLLMK